jgi:hypothetical protein
MGPIGTEGRRRLGPYPDPATAINGLAIPLRAKRRRATLTGWDEHAMPAGTARQARDMLGF